MSVTKDKASGTQWNDEFATFFFFFFVTVDTPVSRFYARTSHVRRDTIHPIQVRSRAEVVRNRADLIEMHIINGPGTRYMS